MIARLLGMMTPRMFLRCLRQLRRNGWRSIIAADGRILMAEPHSDNYKFTPIGAISFVRHRENPDLPYEKGVEWLDDWNNAGVNLKLVYMAKYNFSDATRRSSRFLEKEGLEKRWIRKKYHARRKLLRALKLQE